MRLLAKPKPATRAGRAVSHNPQDYLKLVASGEIDETMLEALEDDLKRQQKRLERDAKAAAS
ncbi:hypothetical protein [Bradyrhizobium sp. UFLA03-84]|uniref:hypothetical protein n=1 Tax=Bradyrhizobium sp. UFLA03-84 TaxID=418599 RepID=UPI0011778110|nr:hypothetical protein [Bradyrhizobium sp. UFLA03-84]